MAARDRLINDLEEEILFLLSLQEAGLPLLTIVECVSRNMNKLVSLGLTHETLVHLEASGLTHSIIAKTKRNYKVTTDGIAALQTDWSHYRRNLYGL